MDHSNTPRVIAICLIVVAAFAFMMYRADEADAPHTDSVPTSTVKEEIQKPEGAPIFTWEYKFSSASDIPRSAISLTAIYPNGMRVTKEIDTVDAGCNEYGNRDADVYVKSTMIMCYYAGLGYYFKVVEKDGEYVVMRKEFEEASPDYNPPQLPYETIAQF